MIKSGTLAGWAITLALCIAFVHLAPWASADEIQEDKAMLNMGGKLYKGAQRQNEDSKISKAIKSDPSNAALYLKRATNSNQEKKYEQAIKDCDKAIEISPSMAAAYEQRGFAYDRISNFEQSVADFDKCIQLDPSRRMPYFGIVRLDGRRRTYAHGVAYLNKFLKLHPNDTEALRYRGDFNSHLKLRKQCFDDLNKAVSLGPKDGHNYQYLARGYYKFNDATNALKSIDIALKLLPKDAAVLIDRGMILALKGDYQSALQQYDKVISFDPTNHQAYNEKAIVLAQLGREQEANEAFDKAVQLDERHRNIYYANHAKTSAKFGSVDDALADVQAMGRPDGKTSVGTIFDTKAFSQAIAQYSRLIALNPKNADAYYDRAVAYVCTNDSERAIADFDRFLKLSDWHGETALCAVVLKAVCLRRQHHDAEAIKVLDDSADRFASAPASQKLIDALRGKSSIGNSSISKSTISKSSISKSSISKSTIRKSSVSKRSDGTSAYEELLSSAQSTNRSILTKCLVGLWLLQSKRSDQSVYGTDLLRDVIKTGARHLDEYALASSALNPVH